MRIERRIPEVPHNWLPMARQLTWVEEDAMLLDEFLQFCIGYGVDTPKDDYSFRSSVTKATAGGSVVPGEIYYADSVGRCWLVLAESAKVYARSRGTKLSDIDIMHLTKRIKWPTDTDRARTQSTFKKKKKEGKVRYTDGRVKASGAS